VQQQIEEMIAKRLGTAYCPIQSKGGEGDGAENVVGFVWLE